MIMRVARAGARMRALRLAGDTTAFNQRRGLPMAAYGNKASEKVEKAMHERKRGTLKSGRSGKTVKSKKQAIAIGLSEARKAGGKVPAKKKNGAAKKASSARKSTAKKAGARKSTGRKSTARKSTARKSTARKSTARKSGARKSASRKTASRKTARRSGARKTARKSSTKRSS
jgi:Family of unknown function (DUF6496)